MQIRYVLADFELSYFFSKLKLAGTFEYYTLNSLGFSVVAKLSVISNIRIRGENKLLCVAVAF